MAKLQLHKGPLAGWLLLLAILPKAAPALAQIPDKFSNLQVLPKDISKAELQSTMRGFAFALNVRCPFCHVQKADMKMDFAADDKDKKKTARLMLQMVATINRDYVSKIGTQTPASPAHVECVTCHHGLTQPRTLNSVLAETIEKHGIDDAIKQYHDLRSQYYGTGQYDFGETTLNQLSESLMARGKNKEAAAIMEMSFAANNPTSVWSFHILAMAHQANGETEKAKADYTKAFALHPDDTWAKQQLDTLSTPK
jgi:tetratricopeptide (TPR) repeat protein